MELPWPVLVGATLGAALVLGWAQHTYQRCPHCGALAPRVRQGWKRCRRCGRQYRKGLRVR